VLVLRQNIAPPSVRISSRFIDLFTIRKSLAAEARDSTRISENTYNHCSFRSDCIAIGADNLESSGNRRLFSKDFSASNFVGFTQTLTMPQPIHKIVESFSQ
jgi:hypothetical protein